MSRVIQSVSWRWALGGLATVMGCTVVNCTIVGCGLVRGAQMQRAQGQEQSVARVMPTSGTPVSELPISEFPISAPIVQPMASPVSNAIAVPNTDYPIFGEGAFETQVKGYLVIREEKVWDRQMRLAYLRVVEFQDAKFKQAIARGIEQQNRVNQWRDQSYELGLGCYENGTVKGIQYDPKVPYLNSETQRKLLASRSGQPIVLRLMFGRHAGSDCECCHLMHAIRSES